MMIPNNTSFFFFAILLLIAPQWTEQARLSEQERVQQWHDNKNVWPPKWQHETDAMKKVLEKREQDIMNIPYSQERWENWLQFTQQRMVPKLTPVGFSVIQIPTEISAKLITAAQEGVDKYDSLPLEGWLVIYFSMFTYFVLLY